MIVVADTSPLNYLIQIECDGLLPQLYRRVVVPPGVMPELQHPGAPPAVQVWMSRVPAWVDIGSLVSSFDMGLAFLGLGEREAIQLAEEQHADLLLIDDRQGPFGGETARTANDRNAGSLTERRGIEAGRSGSGLPSVNCRNEFSRVCSVGGTISYSGAPARIFAVIRS
jgi:predicted nucleic acid-binding protein